jgi:hypothetical protein
MTTNETLTGYNEEPLCNIGIDLCTKVNNMNTSIGDSGNGIGTMMDNDEKRQRQRNCYVPNEIYNCEWIPQGLTNIRPLPTPLGAFLAVSEEVCLHMAFNILCKAYHIVPSVGPLWTVGVR